MRTVWVFLCVLGVMSAVVGASNGASNGARKNELKDVKKTPIYVFNMQDHGGKAMDLFSRNAALCFIVNTDDGPCGKQETICELSIYKEKYVVMLYGMVSIKEDQCTLKDITCAVQCGYNSKITTAPNDVSSFTESILTPEIIGMPGVTEPYLTVCENVDAFREML
jgi:hypothetical protein